jgi:hypothetical protein
LLARDLGDGLERATIEEAHATGYPDAAAGNSTTLAPERLFSV